MAVMEQLQFAGAAAAAAGASAENAALIYVRKPEALCMLQAATWLAMMQQQDACDPLAGAIVGLQQQGTGQIELLLVRSSRPAGDNDGELCFGMLDLQLSLSSKQQDLVQSSCCAHHADVCTLVTVQH